MAKGRAVAKVGDTVVAEASAWEEVDGNVYFPLGSLGREYLVGSSLSTTCPWKGEAGYYSVAVPGADELRDAAWFYASPKPAAENIRDHVAFDKTKVTIEVQKE